MSILLGVATLLLIRHAVTDATGRVLIGTMPGVHLSAEGQQQAGALAARLAGIPLAALYSSPLERCVETAEAIARGRRVDLRTLPALQEVSYGRWTGRTLSQLRRTRLWPLVQQAPSSIRFPDGETLVEVQQRAVETMDELSSRHRRGLVGVVSHGDVIRLALAHYAGVHIDLFQRLVVVPASVSVVARGEGVPRILAMNHAGDLGPLLVRPRRKRPGTGRS